MDQRCDGAEMGARERIEALRKRMARSVIGQRDVMERIPIGLLADGNILAEGLPGLATTRAIKAMAKNLECDFSHIQVTPDLRPADITGPEICRQTPEGARFDFGPRPIFANLVLADEINRAPAKVQAALLAAMEQRQLTVADEMRPAPPSFMVTATQHLIEQQGAFPSPEAQMDRFM